MKKIDPNICDFTGKTEYLNFEIFRIFKYSQSRWNDFTSFLLLPPFFFDISSNFFNELESRLSQWTKYFYSDGNKECSFEVNSHMSLLLTYLFFFQARQILDVEFERLINEGTHRQLGIPSDGRNSASSMGSLGDRSISPVSWEKSRTKSRDRKSSSLVPSDGLDVKTEEDDETESDLSSRSSVKTVSQRRL